MQRTQKKYDWLAIGLYLAIVLFGWFNIYAAVYNEAHTAVFDLSCQHGKQIIWMGIAFFAALVIVVLEPRVFSNISYIIYIGVILLLVAVLFVGESTNGGQSWFNLGSFKLQPSEFAKVGTALALSKLMSGIGVEIRNFRTKLAAFALLLIPAALILLQHDTGSALVFAGFLFPLFREGLSGTILVLGTLAIILFVMTLVINKYILIGIIVALCLAYLFVWLNKRTSRNYWHVAIFLACCCVFIMSVDFAFNHVLEPHQQERINVLLGKSDDIKGAGYNQNQSKIAIGSGEFLGKGWCKGVITKADFVPEQETDFIFCTVGEEWGFVGSSLLVAAYIGLLLHLVTMAERQRSTFARFYGYSVASILFMHVFINIGMVLGLLPVIGIPLPFFSYGGSSLLAFTILLFIFIRQDADKNILL
ncbi:MAG: rod shape-determining protein RodA [Bacteroidales bacterium]|nr:rod shape-determining protein RodA [Bacteroidales bacterium]